MLDSYVNGGNQVTIKLALTVNRVKNRLSARQNGSLTTKVVNTANGMVTRSSLLTGKMMARNLKISGLDRSSVTLRPIFGRLFHGRKSAVAHQHSVISPRDSFMMSLELLFSALMNKEKES